jgi:hypothetical protein
MTSEVGNQDGPVFVFGSNLAGRHGKGAALYARQHFRAQPGIGEGRTGNAYAIPTKDENLRTLRLDQIGDAYLRFRAYAQERPGEWFILTPIGCGLAGYSRREIGGMVKRLGVPNNVALANSWLTDAADPT